MVLTAERCSSFMLSLAPRAQEFSNAESMVSTCSHLVPEESVERLELSTPEVRWQWYRAQSSFAPDLGRFPLSLPGVAGSPSVFVENSQSVSQLPGQPVASLPVLVPQLVDKMSVSKSSQQIVDKPVPKVVKKKRAVTLMRFLLRLSRFTVLFLFRTRLLTRLL